MKARHFLQTTSEIIGKHRHRPRGLIESKTETGFLHAQAGPRCRPRRPRKRGSAPRAGDQVLDQESFEYRPSQEEMKRLALEGVSLLFIDCLKGK